ncbi:MAG: hypothetical protein HQK88_00085 [Nitrospirae bacterium]|nr:hypothetical protein [Nitrospirota bacterium]MBF0535186.1 hypothetical protein [Nitrospirota bacterium]MBF0615195.1 hypothetical protein [Nitrospirota bacterium]
MPKIVRVDMGGGKTVLIESSDEDYDLSLFDFTKANGDELESKSSKPKLKMAIDTFKDIQETIQNFTNYTINAFKEVAFANVSKVKLEFGLKLAGEAGIPLVTSGSAEGTIKITVECDFPKNDKT